MLAVLEYSGPNLPKRDYIETCKRSLLDSGFEGRIEVVASDQSFSPSQKGSDGNIQCFNNDGLLHFFKEKCFEGNSVLRIRPCHFPLATSWINRFIAAWRDSGKAYYHTDGDEFGLYGLTMEMLTKESLKHASKTGTPFLPDETLNAFYEDAYGIYTFQMEDMADYYEGLYKELYASPRGINMEVSTHCNLRCEMCCFHSDRYHAFEDRKTEPFLKYEDFLAILDNIEVTRKPLPLDLTSRGEPFMNKEIVKMVKEASRRGFEVNIVTNGTLLEESTSKALIDAGLSSLFFSIDAATQKTYEKIRKGALYSDVEKNVNNLLKQSTNGLKVGLKYVLQEENRQEVKAFLSKWLPGVDWIVLLRQTRPKDLENPSPEFVQSADEWEIGAEIPMKYPCRYLWCGTFVSTTGEVVCCSTDQFNKDSFGSLKDRSMYEIWNSPHIKGVRQEFLKGNFRDLSVCSKCSKDLSSCVTLKKGIEGKYFYKTTSSYKIYRELS